MTDDGTAMREDASMHRHEHHPEPALRHPLRRADPDAAATALAARAAAAGRTDALGQASVLRLQRAAGNAGVAQLLDGEAEQASPVKHVIGRGGGTPLEPAVRNEMESSFGTDFSDVRVHTGGDAAASAQAVDAHAYTVGNEIVLGDGQAQGSAGHDRTLAHELTHVVQQRSGPVEGTPAPGGISISSPTDRFERAAEATADAVMSTGRAGDVGGHAAPAIQRGIAMDGPAEESVQELAIQRRDESEEEPEDVPRPESGPAEVQRPEGAPSEEQRPGQAAGAETAGPAQAGATEAAMPEEEEREEVQGLAIQRQEETEEEEVQTLAIQRAARDERIDGGEHLLL
jgi:Domain of unknown function (DUF4157)